MEQIQPTQCKEVSISNTSIRFFVTPEGQVYSLKAGKFKLLKQSTFKRTGYNYICVINNKTKKTRTLLVHRMVTAAFLANGNYNFEGETNHKDFNKTNNNISNLEIVTRRENLLHAEKIQYSYVTQQGKKFKAFYKKHLGTFNTAEEASRFVKKYFEENGVPFCKYLKFA